MNGYPIPLVHVGGTRREARVLDIMTGWKRQLVVYFMTETACLDLEDNQLVLYRGKIVRRFPWRVPPDDLRRVRALHEAMARAKGDTTKRREI